MSEHRVEGSTTVMGFPGLLETVTAEIRQPDLVRWEDVAVYVFTPDLTTSEVTRFGELVAAAQAPILPLADHDLLRPFLATLRTFQQQSQSDFMGKTAAERDREVFGAVSALIRVVRVLLRD